MYERFTDRARKIMQLATKEALKRATAEVSTEHVLLGLVLEGSGVAANVLKNLDLDLRKIRMEVESLLGLGSESEPQQEKLPLGPSARRVIEYAMEEARNLRHTYNGSEHLLLGMLRERDGVAAKVLANVGVVIEDVREEILNLLGHGLEPDAGSERLQRDAIPSSPTSTGRYDGFSDRARKVVQLANQEAQRFNHQVVEPEHILLGLVKEGSGIGANVLKRCELDLRKIRLEIEKIVEDGPDMVTMGKLPWTPKAMQVRQHATQAATDLGADYIGTEHLLVGLVQTTDSISQSVLMTLGLTGEGVDKQIRAFYAEGVSEVGDQRLVSPARRHQARGGFATWQVDPRQGRSLEIAGLPDDVDYVHFLAGELSQYCAKREAKEVIPEPPVELKERIGPLDTEIASLQDRLEEAIADQDFEKAAGFKSKANLLKEEKESIVSEWRKQVVAAKAEAGNANRVQLTEFASIHLSIFRAQAAIENNSFVEATDAVEQIKAAIVDVLNRRMDVLIGEMANRLEFLDGSVDDLKLDALKATLGTLQTDRSLSLTDRARQLKTVQQDAASSISRRHRLVAKVNVFDYGARDIVDFDDGDTVATLVGRLKAKYDVNIGEYLFKVHNARIPLSEVRLIIIPDAPSATGAADGLAIGDRLIDIPERDTEGITWYPEWTKMKDSMIYTDPGH